MKRLSGRGIIAYSFGSLAAGLYYAFNNFTLPLYLSRFTSNAIIIGWLASTRSGEQLITQPIVGKWSDQTWTRFGRRAPFFLIAMPLSALLIIFNGVLPFDPSLLGFVIATVFLFSLVFNFGIDPYVALLADAAPSEQRAGISGIANFVGFLGQFALLIAAATLFDTHPGFVFFLVAGGIIIGFGLVALGVRERRELVQVQEDLPARPVSVQSTQTSALFRPIVRLIRHLRELYRNHPEATKLLGVKFLYQIGINAAAPFLTLFVVTEIGTNGQKEFIESFNIPALSGLAQIDATSLSQLTGAFFLLVSMLAALPSGFLGDRFGKKRVFAVGLLVLGIFAALAAFATTIPQLLFYLLFIGSANSAISVVFFPYLSDLAPKDQMGYFQGLSAAAETGGVGISVLISGALINLNLYGSQYRPIFIVMAVFLLLGALGTLFVKAKLELPSQPPVETTEPAPAD
jgi:maltose/moltooligosaccharide transporter